jgi:sec-independent protein translocase protein TatA
MFGLGWPEMAVLALLGLLLFGRRLPEVGKSLGKGIVEFRRGLKSVETELNEASSPYASPTSAPRVAPPLPQPQPPVNVQPPASADGADVRVSRSDAVG